MFNLPAPIAALAEKIDQGGRLTRAEAKTLLTDAPLALLGLLATRAKERVSGKVVFYNRNFHIEPTNICVFNCRFCSYRRPADSPEAWDYSMEEILNQVEQHKNSGATEVHIVGGVHPRNGLDYYIELIRAIRQRIPQASVKAFTAIELAYMIHKAGLSLEEGLARLKEAGMEAIPGGGAEIFAESVRSRICPEKGAPKSGWLSIVPPTNCISQPTPQFSTAILSRWMIASTTWIGYAACKTKRADSTPSFRSNIAVATTPWRASAK